MRRFLAQRFPEYFLSADSCGSHADISGREQYVATDGCILTGREVEFQAQAVASLLRQRIAPGSRVVLVTDDAFVFSVFLLASWTSGLVPVTASSLSLRDILAVPEGKFVLTVEPLSADDCAQLASHGVQNLAFPEITDFSQEPCSGSDSDSDSDFSPLPSLDFEPSIVQMTSGSTGKPQAIARTLKGLMQEVNEVAKLYPQSVTHDSSVVMCATVPIFHAYGLCFRYLLPLFLGRAVMREAAAYEEQLGSDKAGRFARVWLVTSPAFLRRLGNKKSAFDCIMVQTAGGRLGASTASSALDYFGEPPFLEILGSTETGVMGWRMVGRKSTDVWNFLEPNSLRVCQRKPDGTQSLASAGVGLLTVGSSFLEPELTSVYADSSLEADIGNKPGLSDSGLPESGMTQPESGYFVTGDLAELKGDGEQFIFLGRQGRIIKLEDNRISLDETEEQLMHSGLIKSSAVVDYECRGRICLEAAVVLNDEGEEILQSLGRSKLVLELRKRLSQVMPMLAIPRRFMFCQALPLGATGKISYAEVKRMGEDALSRD